MAETAGVEREKRGGEGGHHSNKAKGHNNDNNDNNNIKTNINRGDYCKPILAVEGREFISGTASPGGEAKVHVCLA